MKMKAAVLVSILIFAALCVAQTRSSASSSTNSPNPAAASATTQVKIDPAKEADIRQLLKLMGAGDLAMQTMGQMEKSIKPLLTRSLPPGDYRDKLVDLFLEKFHSKIDAAGMVDIVVPVYDKYLDASEVKSLIQLYQTPIGQKLMSVLPKLTAEAQAAGEQWGRELGRQCMEEVLAENPDMQKAMEQARQNAQARQP